MYRNWKLRRPLLLNGKTDPSVRPPAQGAIANCKYNPPPNDSSNVLTNEVTLIRVNGEVTDLVALLGCHLLQHVLQVLDRNKDKYTNIYIDRHIDKYIPT